MSAIFKVGDVVRLKSGGMPMTISQVGDDFCEVVWADNGRLYRERLPLECFDVSAVEFDGVRDMDPMILDLSPEDLRTLEETQRDA